MKVNLEQVAVTRDGQVTIGNVQIRFARNPDFGGRWTLQQITALDGDYLSITRLNDLRLADLEVIVNHELWP